jgi:hypothetical protein
MRIDRTVTLMQSTTIRAYQYWQACRGGRVMPSRKLIRPKGMRDFVAHARLIEIRNTAAGVDYAVRIAGTKLEEIMGPIIRHVFFRVPAA